MRFTSFRPWLLGGIAVAAASLSACRDVPMTAPDEVRVPLDASRALVTSAPIRHPGRSLAANCFQCHGTDGFAGELKIAGESAAEIIGELNEMRAASPRANIMNVHAAAYTPQEIALIADYFHQQGG